MTFDKFDRTETILRHIDNLIVKWISEGKNFDSILIELKSKLEKFENTISNCKEDETRYKYLYTHNKVCRKRITDILYAKTLMFNYEEFSKYSSSKMFGLIKLRDKLTNIKFNVVI